MNRDFIHIDGLSHRYPGSDHKALDNLTLSITAGSNFGLLGPNGAGKTTLLSILTGLNTPQAGQVAIAGQALTATHGAHIKTISAYVPQEYAFYLNLTGQENLRFFADVYGLSRAQWREQLDYVVQVCRLQDLLQRRAGQYSGGMKRRLNLAIGLLNAPRILYLDEPTVGIDAVSRQIIIAAIQALRTQGATVIYTSHYMEEVEALCDEIAVINHGRLVLQDRTSNLLQQNRDNLLLLNLAADQHTVMAALQAWSPRMQQPGHYQLRLSDAQQLHEVMAKCAERQLQVRQVQFGVSRLEQIYLSLLQDSSNDEALP